VALSKVISFDLISISLGVFVTGTVTKQEGGNNFQLEVISVKLLSENSYGIFSGGGVTNSRMTE
jgi:hypothetical protein